jgi:uncharacterized protein YraI
MKAKIVAATLGLGMVVGSLIGGTQAGATPGGGAKSSAASNYACDCETKVVTSSLNLRKGPGTNYEVLYVMKPGLEVQMDLNPDMHQNGFAHISWDNGENYGWAYESYLADPGSGSSDDGGDLGDGWQEGDAEITGVGVVTTNVNFRSGPGTSYDVQFVIEQSSQIALTDVVVNGFRNVWASGYNGWVYDDYILNSDGYFPGDNATTTSRLNLRAQPNLGAEVLLVIPDGASVLINDDEENGFRYVTYNGVTGWAWEAYLA